MESDDECELTDALSTTLKHYYCIGKTCGERIVYEDGGPLVECRFCGAVWLANHVEALEFDPDPDKFPIITDGKLICSL